MRSAHAAPLIEPEKLRAGKTHRLKEADAALDFGWQRESTEAATAQLKQQLGELQYQLYADGRFAVLVVLQAIDGGGKDSTTRHVFSAFNPQGCTVTAFKTPTAEELAHDFLWRVHRQVPRRGEIAIFNRSHYEDVLVARVDKLVPREVWSARYEQINDFERLLASCGTVVLKIFLHLSRDEQQRRFAERMINPTKQWKLDPQDLTKREQWDQYREAFEAMLERCSPATAPWYVVPADKKWVRDHAVAGILLRALEALPLRWPPAKFDPRKFKLS